MYKYLCPRLYLKVYFCKYFFYGVKNNNNNNVYFLRWYNDDTYVVVMNVGKSYSVVNLTAFDLIFGQLEVEVSSVLSTRATK